MTEDKRIVLYIQQFRVEKGFRLLWKLKKKYKKKNDMPLDYEWVKHKQIDKEALLPIFSSLF